MVQRPPELSSLLGGHYRIERELGRGASATVYLAQDLQHDRQVAIKVLRPELALVLGPDRFLREIRIAATLRHPNILPLFDSGESEGLLYYVMPYAAGDTLRARLDREGQLPLDDAIRIVSEAADGLGYAHQQGIIHRDVKPENILLEAGHAVVADFGIAQAVSGVGEVESSSSGLAVGTPAYMSPEQLSAARNLDGRSDVYSLGCVLYEMLAGERLFSGPTPQAVASRHLHERVPSLDLVRPGIPGWVQAVLEKALAKSPADRYRSSSEFARALLEIPSERRVPLDRRRRWGLWVMAVGVALAGGFEAWRRIRGSPLDPRLYAVVGFRHVEGSVPQLITGQNCATFASEALSRWRDLGRVDPLRLSYLIERRGRPPADLRDAVAVARDAGAGRLIWGEVSARGELTIVRGVLFDTRRGEKPIRDSHITLPNTGTDSLPLLFALMVDSLVGEGQPRPSQGSTQPFAAAQAFAAGMAARGDWDLAAAQDHFRRALLADPKYPAGNLRFAEVSQWLDDAMADWRAAAAVAAGSGDRLTSEERLYAGALVDLADQRYPESCRRFRTLIDRDPSDFAAWYGLGECQLRDQRVEADVRSPSGWSFRSSYEAASRAYLRALEIVPSAQRASQELMLRGLTQVLITTPGNYLSGRHPNDPREFGAFPALLGDTIGFVPYPLDTLLSLRPAGFQPAVTEALERNRRMLDELTGRLVVVFPNSATAWAARAGVLERAGLLQATQGQSAIQSLRRARGLARTEGARLDLVVAEVRIWVKIGEFAAARLLADSALRRWVQVAGDDALRLAPLAGLLGKSRIMLRLAASGAPGRAFVGPAGELFRPPASLARPALQLLVYSVLGGSRDSVEALEASLNRSVSIWPVAAEREPLRTALLGDPAQLGFPAFGPRALHHSRTAQPFLLGLQARLSRGDTSGLRRQLHELDRLRLAAAIQPGQVGLDAVYEEAWLRLLVGDTVAAVGALDEALDGLAFQRTLLFSQLHGPALLVQALALRARLAAQAGDRARASRWARAVVELWQNADSDVGLDLDTMRALAAK